MKVAILGVGTVGSEVVNILQENKDIISLRAGEEIIPVVGVVSDINKKRNCDIALTSDMDEVLKRDDIDVYVELMGGVEYPFKIVSEILKRKKPVVTANKALLAYHRYALERLAGDTAFGYEASVAGGIPIIKTLKEGLSANRIEKITGILNGTSNYILSSMMKGGVKFKDALAKAQSLGYAEADPTFDIGGFDAAHKLLILASIAYGVHGDPEEILIEGIENITSEDIYFAKEFDYVIKLLAIAKKSGDFVELRVHPTMIEKSNILAKVNGVMNGISVFGDALGESMYYGPGAGGKATASAVISDLIDITRGNKSPILGYKNISEKRNLLPRDEIKTNYYIKLNVTDEIGVLSKITNLMSENLISINSFLQKPRLVGEETVTLFFTTHITIEKNIMKFIKDIKTQSYIKKPPFMMRIEE
ncbi:MAG: homoserine dehydrogenase [Campylobacter sp.]|nr:homoserine dehydrogenase [Campylobacter sp.]